MGTGHLPPEYGEGMQQTRRTAALVLTLSLGTLALHTGGQAGGAQGTAPSPFFSRLTEAERQLLLATAGISSAEQFLPGVVPAGLPFPAPTLPGQRVVGAVTQPWGRTQVVWRSSLGADQAHVQVMQTLSRAGWVDQYPQADSSSVFRSAPDTAPTTFMPLCKPGVRGTLMAVTMPQDGPGQQAGSQVSLTYTPQDNPGGCPVRFQADDPAGRHFYSSFDGGSFTSPEQDLAARGVSLPVLLPPTGAEVEESGSLSGSDGYEEYATVFSALDAARVQRHYVAALQGQGWTLVGSVALGPEQVARLSAPATGGRIQTVTLSLMPRPEAPHRDDPSLRRYDLKFELRLR